MKTLSVAYFLFIIAHIFSTNPVNAQDNGVIIGNISDQVTEQPLIGANIVILGTNIGAASDRDGNFRITGVPIGREITVVFSYLGYQSKQELLHIESVEPVQLVVELRQDILTIGEEVVVTSQLLGQAGAIRDQLSSNTIVNVVSQDRIRDLPDQNAAESIGRLPGVSIQRDAGEGQKVVIRGLSPRFTAITVDGEKIPSTDGEDRSVDLSMISSDILAGIEVFKALTPEMDADAVGGTVNLVRRSASSGFRGDINLQPGYNSHESDYGQYRGSISLSNRFLSDKLGVIFSGNLQRANRSSDLLDAGYTFSREQREGEERAIISVNNLNLNDRIEIRRRYGASISLDYRIPRGSLTYNTFWSQTDRDEVLRRKRYRVGAGYVEHLLRDREINMQMQSHALTGTHDFQWFVFEWRTSYSGTNTDIPFSHMAQFREVGAFTNDLIENRGPELIPLGAKNDLNATTFFQAFLDNESIYDRDLTFRSDVTVPYAITNRLTGYIKLGAKYLEKNRERDKVQDMTPFFGIDKIGAENPDMFMLDRQNRILIGNFIHDRVPNSFLQDRYSFNIHLNRDLVNNFLNTFRDRYLVNQIMDQEDYVAGETVQAGYVMTELNLGPRIMLIAGARIEDTKTKYETTIGDIISTDEGVILTNPKDTTGGQHYSDIFPMYHLRIKPTGWFDIRFAITRSMSRPNYFNLVPWERISVGDLRVDRGNPDLKHTTAWNYDVYLTFHNYLGLFTIGGFYKKLDNIDYIRTNRIQEPGRLFGFMLTQPVNAEAETKVSGYEIELQTNLRLLPSPFDGVVLYFNYSRIQSETYFPLFMIGPRSPDPPFRPTIIDTVRAGTLPGQSDHIGNISVGYEKRGFSGRISMIYQGESLQFVGSREELDGYTSDFLRWDLSIRQRIGSGFSLLMSINNLTSLPEEAFLGIESFPTREEYFGWTVDVGVRYQF